MWDDALARAESSFTDLEHELDEAADELQEAGDDLADGAGWPEICEWWKKRQGIITRAIKILKSGKIKIIIVSVKLPKFLRVLGGVLEKVNAAMLGACA